MHRRNHLRRFSL
ncbi:hypothetical protein D039_4490A, partial [Vibrio parahaemolyticus EKP-028]